MGFVAPFLRGGIVDLVVISHVSIFSSMFYNITGYYECNNACNRFFSCTSGIYRESTYSSSGIIFHVKVFLSSCVLVFSNLHPVIRNKLLCINYKAILFCHLGYGFIKQQFTRIFRVDHIYLII